MSVYQQSPAIVIGRINWSTDHNATSEGVHNYKEAMQLMHPNIEGAVMSMVVVTRGLTGTSISQRSGYIGKGESHCNSKCRGSAETGIVGKEESSPLSKSQPQCSWWERLGSPSWSPNSQVPLAGTSPPAVGKRLHTLLSAPRSPPLPPQRVMAAAAAYRGGSSGICRG